MGKKFFKKSPHIHEKLGANCELVSGRALPLKKENTQHSLNCHNVVDRRGRGP